MRFDNRLTGVISEILDCEMVWEYGDNFAEISQKTPNWKQVSWMATRVAEMYESLRDESNPCYFKPMIKLSSHQRSFVNLWEDDALNLANRQELIKDCQHQFRQEFLNWPKVP
jgi:hypothetical protein